MLYDNYRNKILRRASRLRKVIYLSPVLTAALVVLLTVFIVFAIAAGTVTDVNFSNSMVYGSGTVNHASAFLSDTSFEYRLKGESEWSSETPKMPGDYDVRVVSNGFFGTRYQNLDTLHVYPRRVSVTAAATSIAYGETPLATAVLNYGDRIVCEKFVFESNVLADTKIKANASAVKIYNAAGEDVTYAYEIETPYTDIKVTKRELLVYVSDATHQYDGKEFSYNVYEIGEGSLLPGEKLQAKFEKTITNVGTVHNVPVVQIVNKYGEDVTHFYNLNEQNIGDLIVTKRPLHIKTGDAAYTFNGEARNFLEYTFMDGTSLLPGHELIIDGAASQTFVGTVNNTMSFSVKDENGNDVTDNYAITVTEGTITVNKCDVTVETYDDEWVYDGEKHSNTKVNVNGVVFGTVSEERYDVKEITNVSESGMENSFTIKIMNGTSDITDNYNITYVYGTLNITPRPITVKPTDVSDIYNGTPLSAEEIEIVYGELAKDNHIFEYKLSGSRTYVSDKDVSTISEIKVMCEVEDITSNYSITTLEGTITIEQRPIIITTPSATWVYDGNEHSVAKDNLGEQYEVGNASPYPLPDNHFFKYDEAFDDKKSKVENVTVEPHVLNESPVRIVIGEKDVTENFIITYEYGMFEVTPRPITVKPVDVSKMYDGTPLVATQIEYAEESLKLVKDTHIFEYVISGQRINVFDEEGTGYSYINPEDIKVICEGEDITYNYDIETLEGKIEITPRPITVVTPSYSGVYDGKEHSVVKDNLGELYKLADSSPYLLPDNHFFKYDEAWDNKKTAVENVTLESPVLNESPIRIVIEEKDVTENFDITYEYGAFEITPRPISVRPQYAEKTYDGTPLVATVVELLEGSEPLAKATHEFRAEISGSRTNVWDTENSKITSISVWDTESDADVTANYSIDYSTNGELMITPRPISVKPVDVSKVYDGTPLSATEIEYLAGSLELVMDTHEFKYEISGSRTNVWDTENSAITSIKVLDKENNIDVTENYIIDYSAVGAIEIEQYRVNIQTPSYTWPYDGKEHSIATQPELAEQFTLAEGYTLPDNHRIQYIPEFDQVKSAITNVGTIPNESTVCITLNGANVTENFDITYIYGDFTVKPVTIIIVTPSYTWMYDGNEHSVVTQPELQEQFVMSANSAKLPEGYDIKYIEEFDKNKTSIIDAGSVLNKSTVCIMLNGEDVTSNFDVEYEYGTFTVLPRSVTIKTPSYTWTYDGNEHSLKAHPELAEQYTVLGGLLPGHSIKYVESYDNYKSLITDFGTVQNKSTVRIMRGDIDATSNFNISYDENYGTFEVTKRPISVRPQYAEKMYDGTPLVATVVELLEGSEPLAKATHEFRAEISGSRTNVWDTENSAITSIQVWDNENNVDVTANYSIDYSTNGELMITPRPITVLSGSGEKKYDGTPLTNYTISSKNPGDLLEGYGHTIEAEVTGSVLGSATEVVTDYNTYNPDSVKIYYMVDGEKVDVTNNYALAYEYGTLTVYPYIASIEIVSPDAKKVYDGTPLTSTDIKFKYIYGELEEGHELIIESTGSITDYVVGTAKNTFEAKVIDTLTGDDVTDRYEISKKEGTLTMLPPTDIVKPHPDPDHVFIEFIPQKSIPVYLKMISYGNYDPITKWGNAPAYTQLINGYNATYLTPIVFENVGYQQSTLQVLNTEIYMLPYYTAIGDEYHAPGDDVNVKDTSWLTSYNVPYYAINSYDILNSEETLKALKNKLGDYSDEELAYRDFVYSNYLDVDDETRNYLESIIWEKGFNKDNSRIILDVAEYIQNVAKYNLDYNTALDLADNVIIEFLSGENFTEGVCRHYAASATLLYRALGIPARYVEGFVDFYAEADKVSQLTGKNCHAWVEVYIDGLGWIQVEVTGSDDTGGNGGSGDSDSKKTLVIKPVYQYKVSDGTPLTAEEDKIVVPPELHKLLKEGYTYKATIVGILEDNPDGVKGTSWVTNFILLDKYGNDATHILTDKYKIEYGTGVLEILPVDGNVIEVIFGGLRTEKGTPLSSLLGDDAMLEFGVHYIYNNSDFYESLGVNLTMWLVYEDTEPMSIHITELNDNVNKYIGYKVESGSKDVTEKYKIKFVWPEDWGVDEDVYTPLEIVARNPST